LRPRVKISVGHKWTPTFSMKDALQVIQALRCNDLRAFIEIKHLYRHKSGVTYFLQRRRNRSEIHVPKTRPFQVFVIGMKVGKMRPRFANDLRNCSGFRAHGLHIQDDFEVWRPKLLAESYRLRRGVDE